VNQLISPALKLHPRNQLQQLAAHIQGSAGAKLLLWHHDGELDHLLLDHVVATHDLLHYYSLEMLHHPAAPLQVLILPQYWKLMLLDHEA
jgi:hypothetical protein